MGARNGKPRPKLAPHSDYSLLMVVGREADAEPARVGQFDLTGE